MQRRPSIGLGWAARVDVRGLQVLEDRSDHPRLGDARSDAHGSATARAHQGIDLVDPPPSTRDWPARAQWVEVPAQYRLPRLPTSAARAPPTATPLRAGSHWAWPTSASTSSRRNEASAATPGRARRAPAPALARVRDQELAPTRAASHPRGPIFQQATVKVGADRRVGHGRPEAVAPFAGLRARGRTDSRAHPTESWGKVGRTGGCAAAISGRVAAIPLAVSRAGTYCRLRR